MPKKNITRENVINEQSINDINYELLKKQFPHAVSVDEGGKYVIDPQKLQMSLDPSKANIKEDGYGLNWVGKKEAYHTAFSKNYKVLKPLNDDNSKNWNTTDNILIKGDNLDALKILRQNYFESIKMIYIDPPYNTKNDGFVYNDNFTRSTIQTLEDLGYDEENIEYIENIQGAKTHSGWLNFMYPRLLLAKDLLKDDGVIFISIDDNEVTQLKLLCDEVFGEDNFIGNITVVGNPRGRDYGGIARMHDNVIVYSRTDEFKMNSLIDYEKKFPFKDTIGEFEIRELRNRNIAFNSGNRPNLYYPFYINPKNKDENGFYEISLDNKEGWVELYPKVSQGLNTVWRWGKPKSLENMNINIVGKSMTDGGWQVVEKYRERTVMARSVWWDKDVNTEKGTLLIKKLFDGKYFDFPKPMEMIKRIVEMGSSKNDLVLDFFAGSGTTAHAVMDLNTQDDGNRKFIAVQWAEKTPEKSEAKKAGYDTIFDITQERIKRAGDKIAKGDIGFRTFEIVEDVKQKIYQKPLEDVEQKDLLAFTQSIVESTEDILYNLLVAESLPLSTKIKTLIEDKLYLASNVAFVLGDVSIDELIAKLKPQKELEYITVYSPNISDDKFTLECESAVSSIGIKSDKLRFRG